MRHRSALRKQKHENVKLQRSWDKYGESAFEFVEIEPVEDSLLLQVEQEYLNSLNPFEDRGYNLCRHAGNWLGRKHSLETRERLSKIKKGTRTGEESHSTRLTKDQVRDLRLRYINGETAKELAKYFSYSLPGIQGILFYKTWKNFDTDLTEQIKERAHQERVGTKLSPDDVREIRTRVLNGERKKDVAKRFRIAYTTLLNIVNRKKWTWVE